MSKDRADQAEAGDSRADPDHTGPGGDRTDRLGPAPHTEGGNGTPRRQGAETQSGTEGESFKCRV